MVVLQTPVPGILGNFGSWQIENEKTLMAFCVLAGPFLPRVALD